MSGGGHGSTFVAAKSTPRTARTRSGDGPEVGQFHASTRRVVRETKRGKLIFMRRTSHAEDDQEVQLGRNLAAAFIAACHGMGLDYARKKYASEPVGEYWIVLARNVIADLATRPAEPERTPTIQRGLVRTRSQAGRWQRMAADEANRSRLRSRPYRRNIPRQVGDVGEISGVEVDFGSSNRIHL